MARYFGIAGIFCLCELQTGHVRHENGLPLSSTETMCPYRELLCGACIPVTRGWRRNPLIVNVVASDIYNLSFPVLIS